MTANNLLEGTTNLEQCLFVSKVINTRAKEIKNLESYIAKSSGNKLIFQKLPKHMRRRAMSYNVKRLPRKVREAHLNQMKKSGLPLHPKRPSRKYKRRPNNLLQDYNRRQKQFIWLETHIWHAKRFHMINRWGYRLPFHPCDKSFRACYRASAKHCLLQDLSYFGCIEINGCREILLERLKLVTNTKTGLTIGAKAFQTGNREGEVVFYQKNSYPFGAIGPVKFMWKPTDTNCKSSCLWLWAHPAFYNEILNCLINIFELQIIDGNYHSTDFKLKELKHSLNRFRLTGPLSHSVLQKALHLTSEENKSSWFKEYLNNPQNKSTFNEQLLFWNTLNKINSASELSPHLIVNLIVSDPRYNLPRQRTKALKDNCTDFFEINLSPSIKLGPIWDLKVRAEVSKNILSTAEILERQRNLLVPETNVPLDVNCVPIMLVQTSGNQNGYCSGWDVILPSNWGRAFWFSFIMWGARAGGVRESSTLRFEQGLPDILYPDTKAGELEDQRISDLYYQKFFRLPPNKRVNYIKNGIVSPFKFPWKKLLEEWNTENDPVNNFYVLRDKQQLNTLQDKLINKSKDFDSLNNCLIPVKITLRKRGRVKKFSIICLAEENDEKIIPKESSHEDNNREQRKEIRDTHKKMLKKLRRQRIRAKENGEKISSTKEIVQNYSELMKSLWLPDPDTIRNSCSRQIIGFVTFGDFSFTIAKGQCVGFIVANSFLKSNRTVLVRDPYSKQYRLADLEIICN